MIYEKENQTGIDISIGKIQKKLYDKLIQKWGNLEAYPRCYSNFRNKVKIIEFYAGEKEYKNLISSEKNKIFFLAENQIDRLSETIYSTKVDLFFTINLGEIYANISGRADEEARADIFKALAECSADINLICITNPDQVFNGYAFKPNDFMQPKACFKVTFILEYPINQKKC